MAWSSLALILMTASAVGEPSTHGKTIRQCNEELKAAEAALATAGESASKFIHDCWWHAKAGQPTPIVGSRQAEVAEAKTDEAAAKLVKAQAAAARAKEAAADAKVRAEAAAAKAQAEAAAARAQADAAVAKARAAAAVAKAQAEAAEAKEEAARAKNEAAEARKAVAAAAAKTPVDAGSSPHDATPAPQVAAHNPPEVSTRPRAARVDAPAEPTRVHTTYRRFAPRFVFVPVRRIPQRGSRRLAEERERPLPRLPPAAAIPPLVNMVPVHIAGVPGVVQWPVFPQDTAAFREAINHPMVPGLTWTP